MTNKTPEITLFFSIGIVGMDENVTEYITIPLSDEDAFSKQMQMKSQIAQMKLQLGFVELMNNQFLPWVLEKAEKEGWELPDSLTE